MPTPTRAEHTNGTGATTENLTYNYNSLTNQLASVANSVGSTNYGTYTYDQIGRLSTQTKGSTTYYFQYDVTGKITAIYSNSAMTTLVESYTYDESGNRIVISNPTRTTYYMYDATGNVLAIYYGSTPTLQEVPVYGSDRIGTYFPPTTSYVYELRDNAGSVRLAVTGKTGSAANVFSYNDYYPFGSSLNGSGSIYRYQYQGAYSESDQTTGYNNFQLRMYDPNIGRWLTVDPAGQFASPYEGMGNDPVTGVDPTGGEVGDGNCCDPIVAWAMSLASSFLPTDEPVNANNPIQLSEVEIQSTPLSKGAVYNGFDNEQAYQDYKQMYSYYASIIHKGELHWVLRAKAAVDKRVYGVAIPRKAGFVKRENQQTVVGYSYDSDQRKMVALNPNNTPVINGFDVAAGPLGVTYQVQQQNSNVSHGGGVGLFDVIDGEYQHKSSNEPDEGFLGLNLGFILGYGYGVEGNVQLGLAWGN